jgi:cellulose synthase/poly-beta-1,6-N-acetylglucosamine synthase-like glycosyltransferase
MTGLDLLWALGQLELTQFLLLVILLDLPRYLIATLVTVAVRPDRGNGAPGDMPVSAIVPAHNEEKSLRACLDALRANGIEQIIVVDDGSTDGTAAVALTFGATVVTLPERVGKPSAMNAGLQHALCELIVVVDADTVLAPDALGRALPLFEPGVGGVGMCLQPRNELATLTTAYQAIEYRVLFSVERRFEDMMGVLPNVSGAAGIFRRDALVQVGGWDVEVAEDAALAMKLRAAGWRLRYAAEAVAYTAVPETVTDLILQRLRWDCGIITIWWRKFGFFLNPFSRSFSPMNLLTGLDVLIFGAVLPLVLPVYLWWLWDHIGVVSVTLLAAVFFVLTLFQLIILLMVRPPLYLLPYVPYHVIAQNLLMRPLRIIALIAELVFSISRYDSYIPPGQRKNLT